MSTAKDESSIAALHSKSYRRVFIGSFISNLGGWIQQATVPFVLYQMRHNQALVGLSVFLGLGTFSIASIFGGSLADRFDRRRVLLITQSLAVIGPLVLSVTWYNGVRSPALILAILVVDGLLAGLADPSWIALTTDCVPRKHLTSAITLNAAQLNAARGLGPVLAGIVLAAIGPGAAFLVNSLSYLAVVIALLIIQPLRRIERTTGLGVFVQLREGFHYVRQSPNIFLGIFTAAFAASFGLTVFWLMPSLSDDVFHASTFEYGLLSGALGVGTIIGVFVVSAANRRVKRSHIVRAGLVALGTGLLVLSQLSQVVTGIAVLLFCGVAFMCVMSMSQASVQHGATDELRGRVTAAYLIVVTMAFPLCSLLEGIAVRHFGVDVVVGFAGTAVIVLGVIYHLRPSLPRNLDTEVSHKSVELDAEVVGPV